MARILAIDTSTQACSCALVLDGRVFETFEIIPRQHANRLLGMIENLMHAHTLAYADLDAVSYGRGPGSFTGLRIAAGVTQGIALGADLPVIPVSTLAAIAVQIRVEREQGMVFSCLDARIDEVYWGLYRLTQEGVELTGEEQLCKPESLPVSLSTELDDIIGAGSGMVFFERMPEVYNEIFSERRIEVYPRAGAIAQLAADYYDGGLTQQADEVNPLYLRDKVTHTG